MLKRSKETEKAKPTKNENAQDNSSSNDVDASECMMSGQNVNNKRQASCNEIEKQIELESDSARTSEVEEDIAIERKDDELEIGTWSNDMAWSNNVTMSSTNYDADNLKSFPLNVTVLPQDFGWNDIRYGSPTYESDLDGYESDDIYSDGFVDTSDESEDESRA